VSPQRFLQQGAHRLHQAFADLERHVSHEAVAHDHVHLAVVKVAALDIADEVNGQGLEQPERLARQLVALGLLLADGEQSDPRSRGMELGAVKDLAHDAELFEMFRAAVDVGADIEEHGGGAGGGGESGGEGGPLHTRQAAENHLGGGHDGAGIAGADHGGGASIAHQAAGDVNRGVFLAAHRPHHLLIHADDLGGGHELDQLALRAGMGVERLLQLLHQPDQQDAGAAFAGSFQRSFQLRLRGEVAAHRVQGDGQFGGEGTHGRVGHRAGAGNESGARSARTTSSP